MNTILITAIFLIQQGVNHLVNQPQTFDQPKDKSMCIEVNLDILSWCQAHNRPRWISFLMFVHSHPGRHVAYFPASIIRGECCGYDSYRQTATHVTYEMSSGLSNEHVFRALVKDLFSLIGWCEFFASWAGGRDKTLWRPISKV